MTSKMVVPKLDNMLLPFVTNNFPIKPAVYVAQTLLSGPVPHMRLRDKLGKIGCVERRRRRQRTRDQFCQLPLDIQCGEDTVDMFRAIINHQRANFLFRRSVVYLFEL